MIHSYHCSSFINPLKAVLHCTRQMVFKMKIWTSQKHTTSVILVKNIYSYEYMLYL